MRKAEYTTMATTVKFFQDADGIYVGVSFSDHARGEDNPDKETGMRVCAAMSVLASYVETLAECAGVDYEIKVEKEPPLREIRWKRQFALQVPITALYNTILSLSAQHAEFVEVKIETIK